MLNVVEMCLNRLLLRFRHGFIVFFCTFFYLAINLLGCILKSGNLEKPVYPTVLVWKKPGSPWQNYWMFFIILVVGAPLISMTIVWVHRLKNVCCGGSSKKEMEVDLMIQED